MACVELATTRFGADMAASRSVHYDHAAQTEKGRDVDFRRGLVTVIAVLALAVVTAACQPSAASGSSNSPTTPSGADALPPDDPHAPIAGVGTCHMGTASEQPLPDPLCTPGAINPDATQATLVTTVCKSGWTKTIRPPASYTDQLKREQIAAYGDTDTHSGDYEEDHLLSGALVA